MWFYPEFSLILWKMSNTILPFWDEDKLKLNFYIVWGVAALCVVSDTETAAPCACELLTRRPYYWTENSLIVPLFTAAGLDGSCRRVRGGHTGGCANSGAMREKEPLEPTRGSQHPSGQRARGSWQIYLSPLKPFVRKPWMYKEKWTKRVHGTQGGQKINMFSKFKGKVRIKRGVWTKLWGFFNILYVRACVCVCVYLCQNLGHFSEYTPVDFGQHWVCVLKNILKKRKITSQRSTEGCVIIPVNVVLLLLMTPAEVTHQQPSNKTRRRRFLGFSTSESYYRGLRHLGAIGEVRLTPESGDN